MKLNEFKNNNRAYLYEGLTPTHKKSMQLWESVGTKLVEAQLTQDQIIQLFQQIEQGATAGGTNRTAIGKGKDVASAVAQAYKDLKAKAINSEPMQKADALYDQAAEKLKQATGGDAGVMQYVQKYRNFAKAHPISQSLIYGALIAAAGITGAGAGGAAALGLFKMVDKLLQGEKFSTAAVAGAETGALAYGAGQLGQAARGGDQTTTTSTNYSQSTDGMQATWPSQGVVPPGILERFPPGSYEYMQNGDYWEVLDANGNKMANFTVDSMNESFVLTSAQIRFLFEGIIVEAELWNQFKSGIGQAAGAVADKAKQVGKNITTKVTADKLQNAWVAAGSPTDSVGVGKILTGAGIDPETVKTAMQSISVEPATATQPDYSRVPDVSKLTLQQKQELLAQLDALDAQQSTVKQSAAT
jgi:hypothetical protein